MTIDERQAQIYSTIFAISLLGIFVSPIFFHDDFKNGPTVTGTVIEETKTNSETIFSIDTDGNKDTVEKVIKLRNKRKYDLYTKNIKEGSQIQFKNLKGKNLNPESIYQIDNFIIRER